MARQPKVALTGVGAALDAVASSPSTSKGRRTRSALVTAAREVFEEVGFRDARIADIAARSGTSYGVFYHYFESKEAVLEDLFTSITGEMFVASRVPAGVPDDPLSKIEAGNRQYLAAAARNARLLAVIEEMWVRDQRFRDLKLQIREPFLRRNEAAIRKLQAAGLADPHLDAALASTMLGGMVENFSLLWFVHGAPYDEQSAIATLTRLWANAIGLRDASGRPAGADGADDRAGPAVPAPPDSSTTPPLPPGS
jgi:AcrR family transcriptional regulator